MVFLPFHLDLVSGFDRGRGATNGASLFAVTRYGCDRDSDENISTIE